MDSFQIQNQGNKIIITIDRECIDMNVLENFLERLQIDHLAKQVNFDENILTLGEEIKRKWWEQHGEEFLQGVEI